MLTKLDKVSRFLMIYIQRSTWTIIINPTVDLNPLVHL
jgi:hypothetical protein